MLKDEIIIGHVLPDEDRRIDTALLQAELERLMDDRHAKGVSEAVEHLLDRALLGIPQPKLGVKRDLDICMRCEEPLFPLVPYGSERNWCLTVPGRS